MQPRYNIIIATGIYPPQVGGPATYAKNVKEAFEKQGHTVQVLSYGFEHKLPTGIRHIWYTVRLMKHILKADFVFALDTFSVGFPAVFLGLFLPTPIILRTGGDFLWEQYVERTKEKVLFKNFYSSTSHKWTAKERLIFSITKWTINRADKLVFSTKWQYEAWKPHYGLKDRVVHFISNYVGPRLETPVSEGRKVFAGWTRPLVWKNLEIASEAIASVRESTQMDIVFDSAPKTLEESHRGLSECYAAILTSLGDISPNFILEALERNKPCIITKEHGLRDIVPEGIFLEVDPLNKEEIAIAVKQLLDPQEYQKRVEAIKNWKYVHTWDDIAHDILQIFQSRI